MLVDASYYLSYCEMKARADAGDPLAICILGDAIFQGNGTSQNETEGVAHYKKSLDLADMFHAPMDQIFEDIQCVSTSILIAVCESQSGCKATAINYLWKACDYAYALYPPEKARERLLRHDVFKMLEELNSCLLSEQK